MASRTTPELVTALSASRWLLPLVADLAAHGGARFAELIHRLSLSRDSCTRTLALAQSHGWVIRNPGHGHPLRPEYILTAEGHVAAARATPIVAAHRSLALPVGAMTRWGLPILTGISTGHDRFNHLSRALGRATPRALSQGLVALADCQLIDRLLVDGRPPTSRYALTDGGLLLAQACLD